MINLLLGISGGGKSYEAVAFHVVPALRRGRKIITNLPLNLDALEALIPGCSELIETREKTLAVAPAAGTYLKTMDRFGRSSVPEFIDRPFSHADDFASIWRHPVDEYGPLYVVDECHYSMPRGRTDIAVEEWFSMHRHHNCDVLLITQSSGKISVAIKDNVQVCYKVRKAIALGKEDSYIRKVLDGVGGGEVQTSERKYESKYFALYRSHTKGVALKEQSADDVAPLSVKFKKWSRISWVVALVAVVCAFWPKTEHPASKPKPTTVKTAPGAMSPGSAPVTVHAPAALVAQQPASSPDPDLEPFKAQGLHITGWMKMGNRTIHTFVVSAGGFRLFELREADIIKAGYTFEPLGECSGILRYKQKVRTVICDAPTVASGKNDAPVVMAMNNKGEKVTSRD